MAAFVPAGVLYSLVYTVGFLTALYFKNGEYHRNDPEVVKRRFIAVSVICFGVLLHICFFVHKAGFSLIDFSAYELNRAFIRHDNVVISVLFPSLLTVVLYLGPIIDAVCISKTGFRFSLSNQGWIVARNLVVAPLAEEFVFRAAIMFHMQSIFHSCQTLCLVSPLFFSLAHFHHVYGEIKHGKSFQSAISNAVFQVCYTTLFGIYSGFLMLRTGNVLSAIFAHSICNYFGLPDPLGAIERGYRRWGLFGSFLAIATHVIGLILWYHFLYLATNPTWFGNLQNQCRW